MKFVQQWEAKQWVLKKISGSWTLVWNFPARGTATRNHKRGREPFSNLESRSLSVNAKALLAAQNGDTEAFAGLTVLIAGNVIRIAQEHQWQRVDMDQALRVATALLSLVTAESYPSDVELAAAVGVADRNYRATWKPRMHELYLRCLKPLVAEIA